MKARTGPAASEGPTEQARPTDPAADPPSTPSCSERHRQSSASERTVISRASSYVEMMVNDPRGATAMAMIYVAKIDCKVELPLLLEAALIEYARAKPIEMQTEVARWRADVRADRCSRPCSEMRTR
ncbi:MAG TPA: hypothetical protein VGF60_21050 [Xanthobacteraceae bacterium]